ncbi:MAG: YebC/PmpR family DNA-binding transcriptional regulator [Planctomycetes bacterium]|nr:YebC/PmpR family DNA-binding transcriptional regulator [Planctomycetota bacterium]
MAGHSHSSNIKFRKDRVDSKRAKTFAKLSRMITVAARLGGGSLDHNARLRLCVDKARVLSMPKDGIDRAIKKGTGEGDLGNYEEVLYEGYGPGGVAMMLEILTDNRHRTAADVRMVMEKHGGNLGTSGAVAWMFERRGRFVIAAETDAAAPRLDGDRLLELVLQVGADDLVEEGDQATILCAATAFAEVQQALAARGVSLASAELAYVPNQRTVVADPAVATRLVKLIDDLEDNDDVQTVFSNEDFPDDVVKVLEQ